MNILLVDDHKIIRDGLRQILQSYYSLAVFEDCSNAEEVISKLSVTDFDIIICDMSMPGRNGIDVVKQVKEINPKLPVLILSMLPEEQYAIRALKAGAAGCINKTSGADEIIKAIERVLQGRKYISAELSDILVDGLDSDKVNPHEDLSDREFYVFRLLAEGLSVSAIADQLSLGPSTVSTHRARILQKMQMKTNADLTKYALEYNLI